MGWWGYLLVVYTMGGLEGVLFSPVCLYSPPGYPLLQTSPQTPFLALTHLITLS
jgi:hypothetical protein